MIMIIIKLHSSGEVMDGVTLVTCVDMKQDTKSTPRHTLVHMALPDVILLPVL